MTRTQARAGVLGSIVAPLASLVLLGVVCASLLSCSRTPPSPAPVPRQPRAVGRAGASRAPGSTSDTTPGPIIAEYAVQYDGRSELQIEGLLSNAGELLVVENRAERFIEDFEVAPVTTARPAEASVKWTRGTRSDRSFVAAACGKGPCRVRYRYLLRAAAKKLDNLELASEEGEVLEAPPSTWLLAPERGDGNARVRFRVAAAKGTSFATGVLRSREAEGAWDIALGDLWTAPYSVFGPLRPHTIVAEGARIDLRIAPGKLELTDDELVAWASDAARCITTYFGRFPLPEALVILVPSSGRWVGEGKTLSGGGGAIFMRVGERAPLRALREDWVLVHEMTHLTFPSVAREHDWAEEGLATYVEPFARARAGILSAEDAWLGLIDGLPNGLPAAGDRGLDRTPTWGRTYWGGALFYLLADVDIRKRTQNRLGLEHALRGILAAGGNNAHRWTLDDAFAAADKAVGVPALRELHDAMGTSPHPVDLDALWRQLGIVRTRGTVRFDDAAPLAAIRRAITAVDPKP